MSGKKEGNFRIRMINLATNMTKHTAFLILTFHDKLHQLKKNMNSPFTI